MYLSLSSFTPSSSSFSSTSLLLSALCCCLPTLTIRCAQKCILMYITRG